MGELHDIIPKTKVTVDGDTSIEKLQMLIKLGKEEERLDYGWLPAKTTRSR